MYLLHATSVSLILQRKMSVQLMEGTVYIKEFFGRLTQWQYKNIVKRVDELIPVIPVALNLARATKDVKVEQPTYGTGCLLAVE